MGAVHDQTFVQNVNKELLKWNSYFFYVDLSTFNEYECIPVINFLNNLIEKTSNHDINIA